MRREFDSRRASIPVSPSVRPQYDILRSSVTLSALNTISPRKLHPGVIVSFYQGVASVISIQTPASSRHNVTAQAYPAPFKFVDIREYDSANSFRLA